MATWRDLRSAVQAAATADGVSPSELLMRAQRSLTTRADSLWRDATNGGPVQVVDVFSGAGGMSAGFRLVNSIFTTYNQLLAVDIDQDANRTYEANLSTVPSELSVSQLAQWPDQWTKLLTEAGCRRSAPLVLIGCAPCQGFSSHRNSTGLADPRNDLFDSFVSLAVATQPDFVLMENVPEICTDSNWPRVERAKRELVEAGYYVHISIHNMAEFGVPQERFRALIVGSKRPFRPVAGHLTKGTYRTVRQAIGHLPHVAAGEVGEDLMHQSAGHRSSTIELIRQVPHNGGNRPPHLGPGSLIRLAERQGKSGYEDIYGRLWWDRPSITMTGSARNPASGRFVHPAQDRGLTVREAALLQGFPGDYQFCGSFDSKFLQIGNAVPPMFAACIALNVLGNLVDPPRKMTNFGITEPAGKSFARLIPSLKAGTRKLSDACE